MRFLNIKQSSFKSVGWAAAEGIINPLFQLALTPYLLTLLGKREFGLWSLSLAIAAFGPIITFASSATAFNRISIYIAAADGPQCRAAWKTAHSIVLLTSTVAIFFTAAMAAFDISASALDAAGITTILASLALLLAQEIDSVNSAVIKANGRFDLLAKVDIFFRTFWVTSIAIVAGFFSSAIACILSAIAISSIKAAIKAKVASNLISKINQDNKKYKTEYDKTMLKAGLWYFGQALSSTMFNTADKFFVGLIFGVETLGSYAVCAQVAQFTHGIQSTVGQVLLPWASRKFQSNRNDPILLRTALIGGAAFTLLPLAIAVLAPTLLRIWISDEFSRLNSTLALALILSYTMLSANIPLHYILLGCDKLKLVTILNIAGGSAAIATSLLTAPLGVAYFALSKSIYAFVTIIGIKALAKTRVDY